MQYGGNVVHTDGAHQWFPAYICFGLFYRLSTAAPVFFFLSFSPSPFGPVGLLWGGNGGGQGSSGVHPRVFYVDMDLGAGIYLAGYCCLLLETLRTPVIYQLVPVPNRPNS